MKNVLFLLLLLAFCLVLDACNNAEGFSAELVKEESALPGDPVSGAALFKQTSLGNGPGCATCHSLEPDVRLIGPSHAGIAGRAGDRISGLSAEEYIRQSISEPDAFVVEEFDGMMYQNYQEELTEEQINDLVAFLLTLK